VDKAVAKHGTPLLNAGEYLLFMYEMHVITTPPKKNFHGKRTLKGKLIIAAKEILK
jgi:hypothetical protein